MSTMAIDKTAKSMARRLGENVAALIEKKGMTKKEVADAAGINRQFLWEVLRGEHVINFAGMKKIADALGVTMDSLLEDRP